MFIIKYKEDHSKFTKTPYCMSKYFYTSLPILYKEVIEVQNQKLFISKYQGIASLFVAQAKADYLHKRLDSKSFKIEYLEWSNKSACSEKPLDAIHMIIDGAGEFKPFKIKAKSYIYKIDATKYSGYLKYEDWMDQEKEATLQGLNSVEFVSVKEHTVELEVSCKGKIRKATEKEIRNVITQMNVYDFKKDDPKFFKENRVGVMRYCKKLTELTIEDKYVHAVTNGKALIIFGRDCIHDKETFEDKSIGHIYNVYTYPKFRRQGQAKLLLEYVIEAMKKKGATKINLTTGKTNYIAQRLYSQFGFKTTKVMKFSDTHTEIRMDASL